MGEVMNVDSGHTSGKEDVRKSPGSQGMMNY